MTFKVRGTRHKLEAEGICGCGKIVGTCGCKTVSGYNPSQTNATLQDLKSLPKITCPGCEKS